MSSDDQHSQLCPSSGAQADELDTQLLELQLPAGNAAPATARAMVVAAAADLPQSVVERARLAASELVTNAVRHGSDPGAPLWVRIAVAACGLRLEVVDLGRTKAPADAPGGGFGLGIVRSLADSMELVRKPGWRVVAEFCAR